MNLSNLWYNNLFDWEVVAQLIEGLLPTTEIRGSNPVIGNFSNYKLYSINCTGKTKRKKKEAENGPFLKTNSFVWHLE